MKELSLFSIVEKGKDGKYTRRALLCQDILRFAALEKSGSFFKERELAWWLYDNNQHWFNFYQDPFKKKDKDSVKVDTILNDGGVKERVDDFVKMGLLEAGTAPAEKSPHDVRVCRCTSDGILLAWLIESLDPTKREKADGKAYEILQSILSIEPMASYEKFHSALYKKYNDKGAFGEFIMDRLRDSLESQSQVMTMGELQYSSLIIFHTSDAEKGKLYLDLWDEAFDEMTTYVQDLLLFNMKLEIEQRMMRRAMAPQKYEKYRLDHIHRPSVLIMEGFCKPCNLGYPVLMKVREYHERTNFLPNDPIMTKCLQCKNMSLHIPTL